MDSSCCRCTAGYRRAGHSVADTISRRMITIAADHKTGDHGTIGAEAAFTQNDLNTFSDAGNDDNTGLGTHVYYNHKTNLSDGKILRRA